MSTVLDTPPIDVDRALTALGLVPAGGTGTAGGWRARRPQDEAARFELLVLAVPYDDRLADRVGRFTQVRHEHLAAVHGLMPVDAARTGVLVDHVPGVSLAAIRRARAPMTDGECVTLLVPLAEALATLSAAGLAHGNVDPEHVLVRPDGRPVLVGPGPGLAGRAAAHDDLRHLLSTVVSVMPEEDGALLAGPSPVPRLRPVLDALLREGGTADDVVARCFATVPPEAVRLPDAAALAGASLLPVTGRPFPVSSGGTGGAAGRSLPRPSSRSSRGRRRAAPHRPAHRRAAVLAVVAVLLVGAGAGQRLLAPRRAPATSQGSTPAVLDRTDPAGAAVELTRRRADVLRTGSVEGLSEVAVADGPSAGADRAVIASLTGRRADGLSVQVAGADVVGAATQDAADVAVTSAMSAYVSVSADGTRSTTAPAPPRTVVLHLRWTAGGWRVWSVSGAGTAP